jgi:hypothetical protein
LFVITFQDEYVFGGDKMKLSDCKLERVSNAMVGFVLIFIASIFTFVGLTLLPVFGLLIAVPLGILGVFFVLAPRSRACTLMIQKVRGEAKS